MSAAPSVERTQLTGARLSTKNTLSFLSDEDLVAACSANKEMQDICRDQDLWEERVQNFYPDKVELKPDEISWNQFYVILSLARIEDRDMMILKVAKYLYKNNPEDYWTDLILYKPREAKTFFSSILDTGMITDMDFFIDTLKDYIGIMFLRDGDAQTGDILIPDENTLAYKSIPQIRKAVEETTAKQVEVIREEGESVEYSWIYEQYHYMLPRLDNERAIAYIQGSGILKQDIEDNFLYISLEYGRFAVVTWIISYNGKSLEENTELIQEGCSRYYNYQTRLELNTSADLPINSTIYLHKNNLPIQFYNILENLLDRVRGANIGIVRQTVQYINHLEVLKLFPSKEDLKALDGYEEYSETTVVQEIVMLMFRNKLQDRLPEFYQYENLGK